MKVTGHFCRSPTEPPPTPHLTDSGHNPIDAFILAGSKRKV